VRPGGNSCKKGPGSRGPSDKEKEKTFRGVPSYITAKSQGKRGGCWYPGIQLQGISVVSNIKDSGECGGEGNGEEKKEVISSRWLSPCDSLRHHKGS